MSGRREDVGGSSDEMLIKCIDEVQTFHLIDDGFLALERIAVRCEFCGYLTFDIMKVFGMEVCKSCSGLIRGRIYHLEGGKCPREGSSAYLWSSKSHRRDGFGRLVALKRKHGV